MKLLYSYILRYKRILLGALVLATLNQGFSLLDPQIFRLLIDRYASRAGELAQSEFLSGVILLLLGSVGVAFASRVAKNFQDYYVSVVTQRVGTELYAESVKHSFSLPYAAFEDQRSGELLLKFQKARSDSQTLIVSFINVIFLSLIGIIFVIAYAFTVHWLVGLVYFLIIPVLGSAVFFIGKRIKAAQKAIVKESASLAGSTTETIRNVELVKSLGLEAQEIQRLNAVNDAILGLELKKIRLIRLLSFLQGTLVNAMRSGLLLLMLWLIFTHAISLGQFFTLFIYSFFIFTPLGELGTVSAQFQEARASMEQLEGVFTMPPEVKPKNAQSPGALKEISFDGLGFAYREAGHETLQNISLKIKDGETIAFVGPSGSGKSTLIKLLVGLYTPTVGTLSFNGIPGSQVDYEELRKRIGLVLQETQLFAGSIRDNLLFVRPEATDEECTTALRLAQAENILSRSENGLGTKIGEGLNRGAVGQGLNMKIGEGGIKLSGGERQRLAIARALLRNPELIIFDEATSSLDSITEKAITRTIEDIARERPNLMTVLVAHRLSTVQHADMIYVLERGKIVEQGSHAELLRAGGLYVALSREQSAAGA